MQVKTTQCNNWSLTLLIYHLRKAVSINTPTSYLLPRLRYLAHSPNHKTASTAATYYKYRYMLLYLHLEFIICGTVLHLLHFNKCLTIFYILKTRYLSFYILLSYVYMFYNNFYYKSSDYTPSYISIIYTDDMYINQQDVQNSCD